MEKYKKRWQRRPKLPAAWKEPVIYHPIQAKLLTDNVRFKVVPAGRRCLAKGTLVCTPGGPAAIESLVVGDEVVGYSKTGQAETTQVTQIWDNGTQEVAPLFSNGKLFLSATSGHKLLARSTVDTHDNGWHKTEVADLTKDHQIKSINQSLGLQNIVKGSISFSNTYDITVGNETNLYILHKGGIVTSNSGKTFHAKRYLVPSAMSIPGMYFAAAPVRDQAKKIFWRDIHNLIPLWFMDKEPSKTDLIYYLKNGSEIHIIGLDKPARIEGQPWVGGIIDEIADCKQETWLEHIRPAFDTIGMHTWAWLIGVPEGLNFYYDLYQYALTANDPEWAGYTWPSSDLLPAKVIDAAKRQLSPRQFRQEYEASFEIATGKVYEDYGIENHTNKDFDPGLGHLIWTHDFNFTPLSSAILQRDEQDNLYAVDEIILSSAVASQAAVEFCERYKNHKDLLVKIYGDASGHIGEKHGHKSDYINIEEILRKAGFRVQMNVPRANPAIKDGQNSLRGKILNSMGQRSLFVNPAKCKYIDKGLSLVQLKKGSTFQEEDNEYQHVTTAFRYYTHKEFPIRKEYKKDPKYWK